MDRRNDKKDREIMMDVKGGSEKTLQAESLKLRISLRVSRIASSWPLNSSHIVINCRKRGRDATKRARRPE